MRCKISFLLCLTLSILLSGCSIKKELSTERSGFYFDTIIQINIYSSSERQDALDAIGDHCLILCENYENMLSSTVEGSDIWNINHANGESVTVSKETAALLRKAYDYSSLSDGAFDCTIAPLSSLWNFGERTEVPDAEAISKALSLVDYTALQIVGTEVALSNPEASVDLGSIAKGYIADQLKAYLTAEGIHSALINLGGNVLTVGSKPDGSNWNIAIRKPFDESAVAASVQISDKSLVTSGCYERYFEKEGKLYHHILDPKTGFPYDNGLYSVTILSNTSTDGDALSTVCFALGLEKGMAFIEKMEHTEALFITSDNVLHYSSNFPMPS